MRTGTLWSGGGGAAAGAAGGGKNKSSAASSSSSSAAVPAPPAPTRRHPSIRAKKTTYVPTSICTQISFTSVTEGMYSTTMFTETTTFSIPDASLPGKTYVMRTWMGAAERVVEFASAYGRIYKIRRSGANQEQRTPALGFRVKSLRVYFGIDDVALEHALRADYRIEGEDHIRNRHETIDLPSTDVGDLNKSVVNRPEASTRVLGQVPNIASHSTPWFETLASSASSSAASGTNDEIPEIPWEEISNEVRVDPEEEDPDPEQQQQEHSHGGVHPRQPQQKQRQQQPPRQPKPKVKKPKYSNPEAAYRIKTTRKLEKLVELYGETTGRQMMALQSELMRPSKTTTTDEEQEQEESSSSEEE